MAKGIALILADIHIRDNNSSLIGEIFDQALVVCMNNKITTMIIVGDVFEYKKSQPLSTLKTFDREIRKVVNAGIEFIFFPGNHDKVDESSVESYLDIYEFYKGVTLIREESVMDVNGMEIYFLPYFSTEEYVRRLAILSSDNSETDRPILLTHIGVEGGLSHNGGDIKIGMKLSLFDKFYRVYSGHYHNRNEISEKFGYIGSVYPSTFGEDNEKGFTMLMDDGSVTYFKSFFKPYNTEEINITEFSDDQIIDLFNKYNEVIVGRFLRLIITGTDEQIDSLDVNHFRLLGIKVETNRTGFVTAGDIDEEFVEYNNEIIVDTFKEFCGSEELSEDDVDFGVELIKQAYKEWEQA